MKKYIILFLSIVLVGISLFLRFYKLDELPRNLNPDEADTIMTYILESQENTAPFLGLNWNGAPLINSTVQGIMWRMTDESMVGLRLPGVILSTASVLALFFTGLLMTRNIALSFFVALALSANAWFLNFSRSSWENIYTAFPVMLGAIGCLYLYQRKNWNSALIFLSAASVLGFYSYHTGKLIPIVAGLSGMSILFYKKHDRKQRLIGLAVALFITGILCYPQLAVTVQNLQSAADRIDTVSVFEQQNDVHIVQHLWRNLRGFSFFEVKSFHFGNWARYIPPERPLIPAVITLFYLVGVGVAAVQKRWLLFYYLFLIIPIQLLSFPTPDAARAVHIVPLVYLFSLLGMHSGYMQLRKYLEKKHHTILNTLFGVVCAILMVTSLYEASSYFRWIQSPSLLQVREPAIDKDEFEQWIGDVKQAAAQGKRFNIQEWKDLRELEADGG